jgi:hypothetical protein
MRAASGSVAAPCLRGLPDGPASPGAEILPVARAAGLLPAVAPRTAGTALPIGRDPGQARNGECIGMRRSTKINLLLLAASVAGALLLLEFAVRLIYADITTTGDHTSYFVRRWYAAHPPLKNHLGFREREFAPAPAPDVYRIAVVGDSFTYGQGILEDERLTNRMEQALNEKDANHFEVLNFGRPGANYEANTRNAEIALREAHPDFVLLAWFVNDVDDPNDPPPRAWRLASKLHFLINPRSALYFIANDGWWRLQDWWRPPTRPGYYDRYRDPVSPLAVAARERLHRLVRTVENAGVPFGFILWPGVSSAGSRGGSSEDFLIDQMLRECAERGWRCLDLRPALARAPAGASLVVNRFDGHPNALANALATRAVLDGFDEIWLPAAHAKAMRAWAAAPSN